MSDAEAWVRFAAAGILNRDPTGRTVALITSEAAQVADVLLTKYRRRFYEDGTPALDFSRETNGSSRD